MKDRGQAALSSVAPLVDTAPRLRGGFGYRFIKRAFDIAFSGVVILVGFLPCLALSLVIVADTKGSPIYAQKRIGRFGKPIRMYKFRTMVADADDVEKHLSPEQLVVWRRERKVDDDPRITRIGGILRKTSLDEIPQFINVLGGSMSVIGCRPVVEEETLFFGGKRDDFLSVKPGITGWWQINERNDATWESGKRQEIELYYAENASLALDAKIFLGTFSAILRKTGK